MDHWSTFLLFGRNYIDSHVSTYGFVVKFLIFILEEIILNKMWLIDADCSLLSVKPWKIGLSKQYDDCINKNISERAIPTPADR